MQTESVGGRGKLFSWCSSTASSVSNRGIASSSPMGRQQHQCLKIPIIAVVDTAHLPWSHLGTLPLDSLPLDDHAD